MLIDRYLDNFFYNYRVPSRLVRYGIIHTDTLKNALDGFEPKFDPAMKAQAQAMVAKLNEFIELMEAYDEATPDVTEEDDAKAESKAKAKARRKSRQ